MRRSLVLAAAMASAMGLVAGACASSTDEPDEVLRRYIAAWVEGDEALAETVTGPDAGRLAYALRELAGSGVIRAVVTRVRPDTDDERRTGADVTLHLSDGASVQLEVEVTIASGRVLAEPSAISTKLDRLEPIRVDRFGRPKRGTALSRDGSRIPRSLALALIEQALDHELAGMRGVRIVAGHDRVLAESGVEDGADVVTSLDDEMQALAEGELGEMSGALVVVDPRTGGIRALATAPQSLATAAASPGSTFKVVTAAAALEHAVLEPDDLVPCPARTSQDGRPIANVGGFDYGRISFQKAFAVSCNTAFARIGVAVGTSRLLGMAKSLGLRVAPDEEPNTISVPGSRGELALWSFGAEGSRISPLHMAGIGSTIAHRGMTVRPGWTDQGNVGPRAMGARTASTLVTMMEAVVTDGTGRNAAVDGVRIAGKTGTAGPSSENDSSDAWFVGLAPSRKTEMVAVAYLPHAGIGGRRAATLVGRFFQAAGVG